MGFKAGAGRQMRRIPTTIWEGLYQTPQKVWDGLKGFPRPSHNFSDGSIALQIPNSIEILIK